MNVMARGLALGVAHVLLVCAVGAKFWVNRATLPRVWVETVPVDPDSLLHGRYLRLRLRVRDGAPEARRDSGRRVRLKIENARLVGYPSDDGLWTQPDTSGNLILSDAVNFYLPEHLPDPSRRKAGERLWVEVSVPRDGAPRPIRLGVKTEGGPIRGDTF